MTDRVSETMKHKVRVVQVLRVAQSLVIEVEADSMAEAIEAVANDEIDLPSASDDVGNVWTVDHCSLEDEAYSAA